jgi:DnaK suppressor protein
MTDERMQGYRHRLLKLGERLEGDVSEMRDAALRNTGGEASGGLSNAPLHLADLATDNFPKEVDVGVLQNEQQVLSAIGDALDRLDVGTYGHCKRCGHEIPEARLQSVPYAKRCVTCEQQAEEEVGVDLAQGS